MKLKGMKVLALIHDDFEDLEYWYPVYRLKEEGAEVHTIGEEPGKKYVGKYGVPAVSDRAFGQVNVAEYDILLVPGGWAPDKLRRFPEVLDIVRRMNDDGKIIGQICHAGWVLISAGILKGKTVTSTPGIKDDMTNAGATWEDVPVVVDGNLVSSRRPPDLPDYTRALIETALKKS
jgi:protease I